MSLFLFVYEHVSLCLRACFPLLTSYTATLMKKMSSEKEITVTCNPNTRLSTFIRDHVKLKGTKVMCGEGGCGSCAVTVTKLHPCTGNQITTTINSCLCPIYTLKDCHVTTVEGLGNQRTGYHPIQKNIAEYNGSQCGYCTPGMVMSIYGLMCNKKPSDMDIEECVDGNLCRCTGYRPILDSAKALLHHKDNTFLDIEDLCKYQCPINDKKDDSVIPKVMWKEKTYFSPTSLSEVYNIFRQHQSNNVAKSVLGNTSKGVFKNKDDNDIFINIYGVQELYTYKVEKESILLGANLTIHDMVEKLEATCHQQEAETECNKADYTYLLYSIIPQLKKIAGTPVRNAGSWAGNLMIKHKDTSFPSDIFTPFAAVDAKINISDDAGNIHIYNLMEFLEMNMDHKIIISITIPALNPATERFHVFKVMPRAANAHAYINAGFYLRQETKLTDRKIENTRIVYGGLGGKFIRAKQTETCLNGKIFSRTTFKDACLQLGLEAKVEENTLLPSAKYRLGVARNLLYLFLKNACDPALTVRDFYLSTSSTRPVSTASYDYEEKRENYPYSEPISKLDSILQASGEARYTGDRPHMDGELHVSCVISDYAKAQIDHIDDSKALAIPGVHQVITASNMVCSNIIPCEQYQLYALAERQCVYAGQPLALVIADTKEISELGADAVVVTYSKIEKPVIDIDDAIAKQYYHPNLSNINSEISLGDAEKQMKASDHVLEGQVKTDSQYHFFVENQTLRVGGAFGGKSYNPAFLSGLCSIAAMTVNRPVRFEMNLEHCMKVFGKRYPTLVKYKVGISGNGNIQAIILDLYLDLGYIPCIDYFLPGHMVAIENAYAIPNWKITGHLMKTDKAFNLAMRSPDQLPACFAIESIIEHAARYLKKEPMMIKEMHLIKENDTTLAGGPHKNVLLTNVWNELKQSISVQKKMEAVEIFNNSHRFTKRGLSLIPTKFKMTYTPALTYSVYIAVYARDGTVAITHGAIEMGQGLNTKVIQVAAKSFGIDVKNIKVHSTSTLYSANNSGTYGSNGSENVCRSTLECCKILNDRMMPFKKDNPNMEWKDLVSKCHEVGLDMTASYRHTMGQNHIGSHAYCVYGACAVEVEVDILTGQNTVLNLDAIYDIGESANPTIDIGQIEGALIMGLGYFRSENEIYDKDTGMLLTDSTWDYKPPTALDIPLNMNIKLVKNSKNDYGVMPSKAVGEPPMLSSCAVMSAIKHAIESYRDSKGDSSNINLDQPATIDRIYEQCGVTLEDILDGIQQ